MLSYPIKEIGDGVFEINEFDGVSMFLVLGSERGLLIDTGVGIGNIAEFVGTLTDKPVDVLVTHNHRDHCGGAPRFKRVYISSIDSKIGPMVRAWTSKSSRRRFCDQALSRHPEVNYPWTDEDIIEYTPEDEPEVVGIEDGHVFNLGDRTVTCYICPGHTPGSVASIDSKTGILFAADCINVTLGIGVRPLENPNCGLRHATVEETAQSLQRLWDMDFDHSRVFNGHTDGRPFGEPLPEWVFPNLKNTLAAIVSGDAEIHRQHIDVIDTDVDFVEENGVRIQFHVDNIKN